MEKPPMSSQAEAITATGGGTGLTVREIIPTHNGRAKPRTTMPPRKKGDALPLIISITERVPAGVV